MERRGEAPGLAAVTTADVLAYLGSLEGLAPTTRRSRLDVLRALLARATAAGLIGADPGAAVHLPALVRQPRHPPLTLTECRRILAAGRERGHRDHVLVVLLLLGLRVGELVGCLVGDLDLDRAELRVHLSKTGARTMALPVAVVAMVGAMLEARGYPPADAALVAGRHGGGPITTRQAARIWVSVLAAAGVAPRGPHQGRRAAAARLLWLAPPLVVARHLGHAVGTLMRYYADCVPADLHCAVAQDPCSPVATSWSTLRSDPLDAAVGHSDG